MTQFQHTLRQLLTGAKTETSRIVKPNEYTWICGERPASWNPRGAVKLYSQIIAERQTETSIAHRIVWEQGKDYAIVPARGVKSVGRFRVESIWRQDVRTLLLAQVKAEGWEIKELDHVTQYPELWFLRLWVSMHDKLARVKLGQKPRDEWRDYLAQRPAERYQAWRMTISVLWETVDWDAPAVRALQIEPHTVY